jgi:hypothetical protein
MTLFSRLVFVIGLGISSYASSDVDIKSGTFSVSRSDQGLSSEFSGFKINRTYSSTVNYEGLFGFGWCSSLETTLTVTAKGQLAVTDCGAGEVKIYNSADFKPQNINLAIDLLSKNMQETGQAMSVAQREELIKSRVSRAKLMSKHDLKIDISKTTYFLNPFPNEEEITFKGNQFVRKTASGLWQYFDIDGRLVLQKHTIGDVIKLTYDKNGIKSVNSQRDQTITFKLNENGRVIEMRGPQGSTKYTYSADDHLLSVLQKKTEEKYVYEDDLLVAVDGDEKVKIAYNPVTRFVSKVTKNDCASEYKYNIEKNAMKFKVDYQTKCKGKDPVHVTYDFQYKQDFQGTLFQKRMVASDEKGKVTSAEYIDEGMPAKIVRNNLEFKFGYDEQSRIISKETIDKRVEYAYGSTGNLTSARVTKKSGKNPAVEMQQFNYDKNSKLVSVVLKNDTIKYSYDKKGRLSKIESKTGPNFSIVNDGLTGNVKRIMAKGIGHFDVKYVNGKILKSQWKGDLNKALAVIDSYELLRSPYEQSLEFGVPK